MKAQTAEEKALEFLRDQISVQLVEERVDGLYYNHDKVHLFAFTCAPQANDFRRD